MKQLQCRLQNSWLQWTSEVHGCGAISINSKLKRFDHYLNEAAARFGPPNATDTLVSPDTVRLRASSYRRSGTTTTCVIGFSTKWRFHYFSLSAARVSLVRQWATAFANVASWTECSDKLHLPIFEQGQCKDLLHQCEDRECLLTARTIADSKLMAILTHSKWYGGPVIPFLVRPNLCTHLGFSLPTVLSNSEVRKLKEARK